MNSYTKAKVWDQVYSTMVNLPSGIASAMTSMNQMHQADVRRELENNYEGYQAVVDYADAHSVNPAYTSRDGFIQAAAEATGQKTSFVDKVLSSNNWDPTKTNNVTMTDWMLQNGYGTNSWRREKQNQKTFENNSNKILSFIENGMQTFAENKLMEGPYTFFDNERASKNELQRLMDPSQIAEATGMPKEYIKSLMDDAGISDKVNAWYEDEYVGMLRDYEDQQQKAGIATQANSLLKVHVQQTLSNDWTDEEFVEGVMNIINETGYNVAFDSGYVNSFLNSAMSSYIANYALDFTDNNLKLSDYEFNRRYKESMTDKIDSLSKAFGDKGIEENLIKSATAAAYGAFSTAYETKQKLIADYQDAESEAAEDKQEYDFDTFVNTLKTDIDSINYNIKNGEYFDYANMDMDTFVNHVSKGAFANEAELKDWAIKNGKTEIYDSVLNAHTSAVSKMKTEAESDLEAHKQAFKADKQVAVNDLLNQIKTDNFKFAGWTDDTIAQFFDFKDYKSYMDYKGDDKSEYTSWFESIRKEINTAKENIRNEIDDFAKNEKELRLNVYTDRIIQGIDQLPLMFYNKDNNWIARQVGFESYKEYTARCTENQRTNFNRIKTALSTAKTKIGNMTAKAEDEAEKIRTEQLSQFTEAMNTNMSAIISDSSAGIYYSDDDIAVRSSMGLFESVDDLMDNADKTIRENFIAGLKKSRDAYAEYIGINLNLLYSNVSVARNKDISTPVKVSYVSYKEGHGFAIDTSNNATQSPDGEIQSSEDKKPSSYDETKFAFFNSDKSSPDYDYTYMPSEVSFVGNMFEVQYDWISKDFEMSEDGKISGKVYDYDAFIEYAQTNYPEMLNNEKFMKSLIAEWNKTYCSIPTSEEKIKELQDEIINEAMSILTNEYDYNGARTYLSRFQYLFEKPEDYQKALNGISLKLSESVSNAISNVEQKLRRMIPADMRNNGQVFSWMQVSQGSAQALQAKINSDPANEQEYIQKFYEECLSSVTSKMLEDFYGEMKSVGKLYQYYGTEDADVMTNGAMMFGRMVSDKFSIGKLNPDKISVIYGYLKQSGKKDNIYDVATSVIFNDEKLKYENLSDSEKNAVSNAVSPLAYMYDKSSYMEKNLTSYFGLDESDLKLVSYNNDVAIFDTKSSTMYTIPINASTNNWVSYTIKDEAVKSEIKNTNSLYLVRPSYVDHETVKEISLIDMKKEQQWKVNNQYRNEYLSTNQSENSAGNVNNAENDEMKYGDNPTAHKIQQLYASGYDTEGISKVLGTEQEK